MTHAVQTIAPRVRRQTLCGFAGAVLGIILICLNLPFDEYVAWQQGRGTQMFHAQWIYDRIEHDRTPIEVAIVGSSRVEAGISPVEVSQSLQARLGRPVPVANLALVMPGRDFAARVVQKLVRSHPEVRLVILSDDGAVSNSHPMFFETARPQELWSAPRLLNTRYPANLLALPYRNLMNLLQARFPALSGKATQFAPADYAGPGLDRTLGYRLVDGTRVNGDRHADAASLMAFSGQAIMAQRRGLARSRFLPLDWTLAIDRRYTADIANLCQAHGIGLAFVRLPYFGPEQPVTDQDALGRLAPIIDLGDLSQVSAFYQDGAHLNRSGAIAASRRLAMAIAPMLEGQAGPASVAAGPAPLQAGAL